MSAFTAAIYDALAGDPQLVAMLSRYKNAPAIFTIEPVPGDAKPPYIVTAGEVSSAPFDTKTCRGRAIIRDVRIYATANGDSVTIEAIAERVRLLLHRRELAIAGFQWVLSDVQGPIAANEKDYYGRVVSVSAKAQEE